MGRSKRGKKLTKPAKDEGDVSEDEGPDPESDDFFHDSVDKFNLNREKILLDTEADDSDGDDSIEEVEDVMALNLPDSDEEEDDDEEEEDKEVDDDDDDDDDSEQEMKLPDDKSWGKKKATYYSADTAEAEVGSDDDALELEKEEEVEALALQKRLAASLDEEDFDTADFQIPQEDDIEVRSDEDDEVKKTVVMDLTKLSKEQKLEMLFRESPELFELLDQFKEKLNELASKIAPLMQLSKSGKLPSEGSKYIQLKYRLYLNYCINIGFYLLLKSKQTPVKDHPVIERIVQYRNLIKQLEPLDKKLESDIEVLLANKEKLMEFPDDDEGKEILSGKSGKPKATKARKKKHIKNPTAKPKLSTLLDDSDEGEMEEQEVEPPSKKTKKDKPSKDNIDPLEYYEKVRKEKTKLKKMKNLAARLAHEPELDLDDIDEDEDVKRAITYQISKNKGLTAKKKKEDRNPRVKHRKKYSKAIIKRKSQVRPVTNENTRYDGEKSGIRAFLTRSVKIK